MAERKLAETSGLVASSRRDGALDEALERLAPGQVAERPDTPDLHVTALRRLPPVPAQFAPFPEALDGRLRRALSLARHLPALHASGGVDRPRARRPQRRRDHADGVRQDALLQRADPARHPAGSVEPRAVSVSDQGAGAGSARRAAGAVRDAGRRPSRTIRSACSPTTAIRRRMPGGRSASRAHLVLSNPDMLHSGILPHHPRWAKLFENLRYVVIDELHAYRGVFGSHLCNVLRRLRRICRHYGSNPVFLCSSATIANPRELAERLTEQPFELVDRERRAARREVLRLRQPAGRQPPARDPAVVSRARRGESRRSS